jgi:signal transduction histidine kinase
LDAARPEQTRVCLILAPTGRDANVAAELLKRAHLEPVVCSSLGDLAEKLSDEVDLVVIADEALRSVDLAPAISWVRAQASWSDLPFIVLTHHGIDPRQENRLARIADALGNVTFLERPFHPSTFMSVVIAAAKTRQRQYQARAHFEELRLSAQRLRDWNETLEKRVAQRTAALESAHRIVLQEIEQRQITENRLRQAQKLEMIGQLTGGVAHDFNNLLMVVLGNLSLLRKRLAGNEQAEHLIEGAVESAQRGAALTQRLLAFARRQDLTLESRNLGELVKGMSDLFKSSVPPGVEFRLEVSDELPLARVDGIQVELALLNLVVNARDAMPDGGRLRVALDVVEERAGEGLNPGKYVRISVTDSGSGMDAETLARATEPFFSTKEVGKGTGLGLSMVHGLAQQLNGDLRLYSEPGRGTRAELWLPVTGRNGEARTIPAEVPESRVGLARSVILVVDDDALVLDSTVALLEDLGHEVVEAGSADEALEVIRGDRPLDLMITDFLMPKMTGSQLANEAKRWRPGLPVLLVTGYAELSTGTGIELPRLRKPFQQQELEAQLVRLLH